MLKVLVIAGGFPPAKTYGGPSVSIDNLCELLSDSMDLYVVANSHELHSKELLDGIQYGWNVRKNCKAYYLKYNMCAFFRVEKIVEEIYPDIIYINSLFSAYLVLPALVAAKKHGISALIAPRGQLAKSALKKKWKKIPYLCVFKNLVRKIGHAYQATSDDEILQIKEHLETAGITIYKMPNIPTVFRNIPSHPPKAAGRLRVIYLARVHWIKNLDFALMSLRGCHEQIKFDIYGPLEDKSYWNTCKEIITELPENVEVHYKGGLDHSEIADVLSKYDVYYLPTQTENFGHSIVEAMMAGCIPLISDRTPWKKLQDAECGWALPLDDTAPFTRILDTLAQETEADFKARRKKLEEYIDAKIDFPSLEAQYSAAFHELISKNNNLV